MQKGCGPQRSCISDETQPQIDFLGKIKSKPREMYYLKCKHPTPLLKTTTLTEHEVVVVVFLNTYCW